MHIYHLSSLSHSVWTLAFLVIVSRAALPTMSSPFPPGYRPGFDNCDEVNALCPVQASTYGDFFDLGGSLFYAIFFFILFVYTTVLGAWKRTTAFTIFCSIGMGFEVMGYGARVAMSSIGTVWNYPAFVIQLLFLILAPTFIAAGISITFKWIVLWKGVRYSIMPAWLYPWVFLGTDFTSIIIQAIGGAVSATATSGETNTTLLDVGSGLLTAGVAFQAANMVFCGGLIVVFWWRYRQDAAGRAEREAQAGQINGEAGNSTPAEEGTTTPVNDSEIASAEPTIATPVNPLSGRGPAPTAKQFKRFCWALFVAYMAVLIRCIYRYVPIGQVWWSRD